MHPLETHGDTVGKKRTKEYRTWQNIKTRCYNENTWNYGNYGGRGIIMWSGWINDYGAFLLHVGRSPGMGFQLDRVNNNGNYEPDNVHWVTCKTNNGHTRRTKIVEMDGEIRSLIDWCEEYDVDCAGVLQRLNRGWNVEKALTHPGINKRKRRRVQEERWKVGR